MVPPRKPASPPDVPSADSSASAAKLIVPASAINWIVPPVASARPALAPLCASVEKLLDAVVLVAWIRPPFDASRSIVPPWAVPPAPVTSVTIRSEEHTSELQSLMSISYAVFCLKKNKHDITSQQQ